MKLYCLPYSGASANVYLKWKSLADEGVELVPLEYPGRGKRFNTALCQSMEELVGDLAKQVEEGLPEGEAFAIFGHSLGGIAGYYLACRLVEHNRIPNHLFLSGCLPPNHKYGEKQLHQLPDHEFMYEIIKLGGMEPEVVANKDLLDIFLPILKTDYKIYETCPNDHNIVLPVPMTIFSGDSDSITRDDSVRDWYQFTSEEWEYIKLRGNHFFIFDHEEEIMNTINRKVNRRLMTCS